MHPHWYIQQVVFAVLQEDAANEVCAIPSDRRRTALAVSDQVSCDIILRILYSVVSDIHGLFGALNLKDVYLLQMCIPGVSCSVFKH